MRLHIREDGPADARPLVLLNSVGSDAEMWQPCVAPLAERFRVLRMDARGHGASDPAPGQRTSLADLGTDVCDTLDALGLDRVDLAGLSLGGMTGMWLAIHRPERVGRLALLCTSALLGPAQNWLDRAAAVRAGGMGAVAEAVLARWVTPRLAARDADLMARLRAMFDRCDPESYAQCCEAIAAMDLVADLGRIAAPTLVIGAEDDPATPPEHQQRIADRVAGSALRVLPDAAHVVTVEQPGRVAALLLEHLDAGDGMRTRRAVLGDAHVDAALARADEFAQPFQDFITRYAWGEVWTRPGLTWRDRSIATVTALVTLGAEHELALHLRAARRNGLGVDELREVLLHAAVYAGVPRANRAFAVATEVLAEDDPR